MPQYNYKCEQCGEIITLDMTFPERDEWLKRRKELRGTDDTDFIHHAECTEVGTSDILYRAYRIFTGKDKKGVPVIFGEGFTKNHDIN